MAIQVRLAITVESYRLTVSAMKAYFEYLNSTNSLGTLSPYEPNLLSSSSSSPAKATKSRKSYTPPGSSKNMMTLANFRASIGSSDKLAGLDKASVDKNESRASMSHGFPGRSKSTERVTGLNTVNQNVGTRPSPAEESKRPPKTTSTAKRLIAGALGVRLPRATKAEKEYDQVMKKQVVRKRQEMQHEEAERRKRQDAIWND